MPESALPPPSSGMANGATPRMGTPQNDTSWAGWAISSFTNKIASTSGEIEAKPNGNTLGAPVNDRSSTISPALVAEAVRNVSTVASASTLHRQVLKTTTASKPVLTRTATEQFFGDAQAEDDEIDDAWGEMAEESFFDASTTPAVSPPTSTTPTIKYDDGGEPDFAGWLTAQAQAKSKAPLPKGLSKSSTLASGRPGAARVTTTGSVGPGAGAKKLASTVSKPKIVPAKKIDIKPKETAADDDWGDAWD